MALSCTTEQGIASPAEHGVAKQRSSGHSNASKARQRITEQGSARKRIFSGEMMARKSYEWKEGCRVGNLPDAKDAHKELERIKRKHGKIEPGIVVDEARHEDHIFHEAIFNMSDRDAARQHRIHIAREIINSVRIVRIIDDTPVKRIAFVSVRDEDGERAYQDIDTVTSSPALRESALMDALAYIKGFQRRYAELDELQPIFDAANEVYDRVIGSAAQSS